MPYIDPSQRADVEEYGPLSVGALTYYVYRAMVQYSKEKGESFRVHAEAVAAVECAKLEYYRRRVSPYEELKLAENGDVV